MPEGRHVRIRLTLRIRCGEMLLDFEGTDPQVAAAFNIPSYSTDGHYLLVMGVVNFMRSVKPDIVYNSGLVRCVRLTAPRGSLLNPEPGAPCGARQATFFRVADIVLGALAHAWRERMPAAGCGQGSIMLVSAPDFATGNEPGEHRPASRGRIGRAALRRRHGGRRFHHGLLPEQSPNEVLESEMPVLVERYALIPDSGGAGRTRGGCGLHYSLRLLVPGGVVTARGMERFHFEPWGREAVRPGDTGRAFLQAPGEEPAADREDKRARTFRRAASSTHTRPAAADSARPGSADPALVLRDVEDGLVTPESAEADYGVVIRDGRILEEETSERRRLLADEGGGSPPAPFTFGANREAFERLWSDDLQLAVNRATEGIPPAIRQHVRFEAMRAVEEARSGAEPIDESWLEARVREITERMSPQSTHSA